MMRTIIWYTVFVISLILRTPQLLYGKRLDRAAGLQFAYKVAHKWALLQLKTSGSTVQISGEENLIHDRSVLFVSNHQSNFDIAIFLAYIKIPKGFVAKMEMEKVPLLRDWMKLMGCVFLDRNDLKKSLKAINEGIKILKDGHSMVVFPEGTRSKSSVIGEFKAGSFKLATKSGAPIIPVTIDGSYKIMEKNKNKIVPAHINVTIHPPIHMENLSKEEWGSLSERVKEIIKG